MLTVRSFRLNDVSHCQWSGGFRIDQDDSFHINMRFVVVNFLYEEWSITKCRTGVTQNSPISSYSFVAVFNCIPCPFFPSPL